MQELDDVSIWPSEAFSTPCATASMRPISIHSGIRCRKNLYLSLQHSALTVRVFRGGDGCY